MICSLHKSKIALIGIFPINPLVSVASKLRLNCIILTMLLANERLIFRKFVTVTIPPKL